MTTEDLIKRDMKYTSVNGVSIEEYVNKNYIHMSVIEDIKAEIQKALDEDKATDTENAKVQAIALMWCLEVIDKHIGDKHENT